MTEKDFLLNILFEQADFLGVQTYVVDSDNQLNLTLMDVIEKRCKGDKKVCILNSEHYDATKLTAYLNSNGIDAVLIDDVMDCAQAIDLIKHVETGITPADLLVAETCTLIICNRKPLLRELSLLPPVHIVIVKEDQLVEDLHRAIEMIKKEMTQGDGVTFITGPSKTADIELNLVKGVHGPKEVIIFIIKNA